VAAETSLKKAIYEEFARFFEKPTRDGFRELVRTNLGERDELDFKMDWPALSKVGRHVLGLANSGGGVLVFGIKQEDDNSLSPVGLPALRDKTEVHEGIRDYLPSGIRWQVLDFHFTESEYGPIKGKKFQVLLVEDDPEHLPFIADADGDDIRRGAIYVRDGVATREASYDELQALINRRIETGHSTSRELAIKKHLDELEVLYGSIGRYGGYALGSLGSEEKMMEMLFKKNPAYPREDFDFFVARMIHQKKSLIEKLLLGPTPGAGATEARR
jgi:hypothetical protein